MSTLLGFLVTISITRPVNRIISDLNEGAGQVTAASDEISSASQTLAEGSSGNRINLGGRSAPGSHTQPETMGRIMNPDNMLPYGEEE